MKKFLFGMMMVAAVMLGVAAQEKIEVVELPPPEPEYSWTFLNIGLFPGMPSEGAYTTTWGVKLGIPICDGEAPVNGAEISVFHSGTDKVNGLQGSLISCNSQQVNGVQLGVVNLSVKVFGVQIGVVNIADDETFQIGLVNIIKNGSIYCLPLINFNF